jgi:hypothetical protein
MDMKIAFGEVKERLKGLEPKKKGGGRGSRTAVTAIAAAGAGDKARETGPSGDGGGYGGGYVSRAASQVLSVFR